MNLNSQRGYFLFNNNFIWTRKGLKKTIELEVEDEILGINFYERNYEWIKIKKRPIFYSSELAAHIFTDQNEAFVPIQNVVSTIDSGRRETVALETGNILEIFKNGRALASIFHGNKISEDTLSLAYLFGLFSNSTEFYDGKIVTIKVRSIGCLSEYVNLLQNFLQRTLDKLKVNEEVNVRMEVGPFGDSAWVILESSYICKLFRHKRWRYEVPAIIRCSTQEIIEEYIAGIFDVSSIISEENTIDLITSIEQHEIRRFLYSIFVFFGISPLKTYLSPSWCPLKVTMRFDPFSLLFLRFKNPALKVKSNQPKQSSSKPYVRFISNEKGGTYLLTEVKLNWSPIADLIYVHSKM